MTVRAPSGGCLTRRWDENLELAQNVFDLLSVEPKLATRFERLYERHQKRLPRLLPWGETVLTFLHLDAHRTASILTSCVPSRGLRSTCWYTTDRRRP